MLAPGYRSVQMARYRSASAATLVFALLFLQTSVFAEQVNASSAAPDLNLIIKKITEAQRDNRSHIKAYSVMRKYKVFGSDTGRPRTEVVAKINFSPPNVKSYDIDQSTGGMGDRVVRKILDHEVDVTRDPKTTMVTDSNYDFELVGEQAIAGAPCYKLRITPKHESKELLRATVWVNKTSYLIVRMEGEPAKNPSFWVKDVYLVLQFADVAGMWLQTETLAMARLRFGGEFKLTSQDLKYQVGQSMATNPTPVRHRRHSSAVIAASVP